MPRKILTTIAALLAAILLGSFLMLDKNDSMLPALSCPNDNENNSKIHAVALASHSSDDTVQCFSHLSWEDTESELSQQSLDWPHFNIQNGVEEMTIEIVYRGETPQNFTLTYRYGKERAEAEVFGLCSTLSNQEIASSAIECRYRDVELSSSTRQLSILITLPRPKTSQSEVVLILAIQKPDQYTIDSTYLTEGFGLILRWNE